MRGCLLIACTAVGLVGWLAMAPTSLGGRSTYITTYGNSMEPTLRRGDLVVVRPQPSYRVGDVVAYRSETLKTVVLHRIVDRRGATYDLKGDNNTWIDTDHPPESALLGRMELRLPGLGTHVQRAASPAGAASLGAVAALPVAAGRRRRQRPGPKSSPTPPRAPRGHVGFGHVEPALLVVAAVGLAGLMFGFTQPPTRTTTRDLPFEDRGEFSYSGAAPDGFAVYQSDRVSSGQPIYLNLVQRVDFGFSYRASASTPIEAVGNITLAATVSSNDGWTYPIELAQPRRFDDNDAAITGSLDLAAVAETIEAMERDTGVVRDGYAVAVGAIVSRTVVHGGIESAGEFEATLDFKLDDLEMQLATPGADVLTPVQGGLLSRPVQSPNEATVLGVTMSIAALRGVSVAIALVVAALWLGWLARVLRGDEPGSIDRRYRSYLLPVHGAELSHGHRVVADSIGALARIADHAGAPILKSDSGVYYVVDGGLVYSYGETPHTETAS